MTGKGFTQAIKDEVRERDEDMCVRCGRYVPRGSGSVHHRRARGMGSGRDPATNDKSNLLTMCGHATEPGTCHEWAEANPLAAYALGYRLKQHQDPRTSPVFRHGLWMQPGESWTEAEPPVDAPVEVTP